MRVGYRDNTGQTGEITGPLVTVWKNPIIDQIAPEHGPIGTPLTLRLRDVGVDSGLIRVQFAGTEPKSIAIAQNGVIQTVVPNGAVTGPITVITPGGSSSRAFTVDPYVPRVSQGGGDIAVGQNSIITLARGIAFAMGDAFPNDDSDIDADGDPLDPPNEEGDYVTDNRNLPDVPRFPIGANFDDRVSMSGTISDDANIGGFKDSYGGGILTGNIAVSGENLRISVTTFRGLLTVSGTSNSFTGCNFEGTVRVTGRGNSFSGTVTGQLIIEGEQNNVNSVRFRNSPTHAAIIKGNHNRILGDFDTNSGDGIRIEGGQFNYVEVNRSRGNGGNGVTLTGGAANNEVKFSSGVRGPNNSVVYGSGNKGHGVALIGDAHNNLIHVLAEGASGNGLDGAYLDGPGVVQNRLGDSLAFLARYNGRNGVTITNGASNNQVGRANIDGASFVVTLDFNRGNGLMLAGAKFTGAAVSVSSNALNGVLVSGVKDPPSGTIVILSGGGFDPGNGNAGLRLEKGTTGVRAAFGSRLRRDTIGVELDGEDVEGNVLDGGVTDCLTDGVVIRGARRNDLRIRVEKCTGSGMVLFGARANLIRCNDISDNQGDGIRFVGASDNRVVSASGSPFSGSIYRNKNGAVFEQGARGNMLSNIIFNENRENGIVLDGAGTSKNSFLNTDILESGFDGLRVQNGASENIFGASVDAVLFPVRTISLHDNTNAAVRITGPGTRDITIAGCFISALSGSQPAGIIVENNASDITLVNNSCYRNTNGVIVRDGAQRVTIAKSIFDANKENGILISNGSEVFIGGPDTSFQNTIYSNSVGIKLTGSAAKNCEIRNNAIYDNFALGILLEARANLNRIGPGNVIENSPTGISSDFASTNSFYQNVVRESMSSGFRFAGGSTDNLIADNSITQNGIGVFVTGAATLRNSILNNSITGNGGNGIRLVQGGNREIAPPEFEEIQGKAITGTSSAPDGSRIQIFSDPGTEGEALFAAAQVVNGRFRALFDIEPWKVGKLFNVNATVTDPDGNTSEFKSKFPDDGGGDKILFTSTRDGNSEIYMIAPPSGTPQNLTQNGSRDFSPAYAIACDEVLFVSDRTGNLDIFSMKAQNGGALRQLTSGPADDYDPEWLEECVKVVFVSERDGNPEVYSMNADGSGVLRLTQDNAIDRNPAPAGDGKILFESNRGGRFAIWIMNSDGSDQRPLLNSTSVDREPVMSPNGSYVGFVSERDGNPEIYIVRPDGTGLLRLTSNSFSDATPAWSPDSSSIVFSSARPGGTELFVVPRTGGIPQPITISLGENLEPSLGRE